MVTNVYAKYNYSQLHIDEALGILKSDNNKNKNNLCSDSGPFRVQQVHKVRYGRGRFVTDCKIVCLLERDCE